MIERRDVLAGGVLLALMPTAPAAALPVPAGDRMAFDVMRKGSKLGTHVLTFDRDGDMLGVQAAIDVAYRFGPITLFHYTHRCLVRWRGEQVMAIDSTTDDNGTADHVHAVRTASGLVVQGSRTAQYVAPADALPATHWNRREIEVPWINTQHGRLMHPRIALEGSEVIPTVGGTTRASHYAVSGDAQLDIFYDPEGWAGLTFKAKDGSLIRYERQG